MSPVLYCVRHGLTDWNAEHRLQGQADIPMNATGVAQAHRNGRTLADALARSGERSGLQSSSFDFVASPLQRTMATMRIVRAEMGLDPDAFRTEQRLKELHFGDWQGFTYSELEVQEPGLSVRRESAKWAFLPPGENAESYALLSERVATWVDALAVPTIAVTHGGVMRTLLHRIAGISADEACNIPIPQDRILRFNGNAFEWI